jgi:hypothetical protein
LRDGNHQIDILALSTFLKSILRILHPQEVVSSIRIIIAQPAVKEGKMPVVPELFGKGLPFLEHAEGPFGEAQEMQRRNRQDEHVELLFFALLSLGQPVEGGQGLLIEAIGLPEGMALCGLVSR